MEEKWKPVKGYEGLYEVSDLGEVRSLKRATTKGVILKPIKDKDGYSRVCLSKNNVRRARPVHRLVAEAFLPKTIPTDTIINHKNEIKSDNRVVNLEWCNFKYNTNYNGMPFRRANWCRRKIKATKDGKSIVFESIRAASKELSVSHGNISDCLNKAYGRKTLKGYSFEYVD